VTYDPKLPQVDGPLDYFVGNANGRGLIRIETGPGAKVAGEHIASLTRTKQNEAYADALVFRFNEYGALRSLARDLANALDGLLAGVHGDGYIPSAGLFQTRTAQAALASAKKAGVIP
jgi:hypothetical protein